MNFNSWQFLIFLPVVVGLYWLLPHKFRWVMLLIASYFFYMSWNAWLIILLMTTTVTAYAASNLMKKTQSTKVRKALLIATLVICLGILIFFKYINFLLETAVGVIRLFNAGQDSIMLNVILPVGISFYTFQTLSYVVDVYRGDFEPEPHFGYFALYVVYFPQLVAGPIERAVTLLPQFHQRHTPNWDGISYGCHQIAWGLFKKVVVADTAAVYVNRVYGDLNGCGPMAYVIATLLFAFQIYCDFSGYSDIALGSARLLGFRLMQNFNCPYLSASIKEFWRRWHISLSTWFQDYVYIPLGGSRCGRARHLRNLFLTFLVSGLWHGAEWTFVIWGGLFGLFSMAEVFLLPRLDRWQRSLSVGAARAVTAVRWLVCFGLVCLCWVFFRADTLSDALLILRRLPWALSAPVQGVTVALQTMGLVGGSLVFLLAALALLIGHDLVQRLYGDPIRLLQRQKAPVRWLVRYAVCLAVLLTALTLPEGVAVEFIYFQF